MQVSRAIGGSMEMTIPMLKILAVGSATMAMIPSYPLAVAWLVLFLYRVTFMHKELDPSHMIMRRMLILVRMVWRLAVRSQ